MKMINTDLTKILSSKYINKWVALDSKQTKVITSGKSPKTVLASARRKNVKRPVVTFVAKGYGFLVP